MVVLCAHCHRLIEIGPSRPGSVCYDVCPSCKTELAHLDNSKTLAEVNARRGFPAAG